MIIKRILKEENIFPKNLLIPILIASVFFLFMLFFFPFREILQFDVDEGVNLMRSMLVNLDYPLYDQISSDQPPIFTYILAQVIKTTGVNLTAGRILVLFFSTLLVWSCSQFLQLTWGSIYSIILLFLILLLPYYMRLSVSIMIGLPAISMATLSLLLITLWHLNKRDYLLILSGVIFGISILIKFFTIFLMPIFLLGITISQYNHFKTNGFSIKWFQPGLIWFISFGLISFALTSILVGSNNFIDIIRPHLDSSSILSLREYNNTINFHLLSVIPFLFLGLIGVLISILRKNWLSLYPAVWAAIAYLLLRIYSPVWYHQQILVTVPVVILCAVAAGEGIMWLIKLIHEKELTFKNSVPTLLALIVFLFVIVHYFPLFRAQVYSKPQLTRISLKAPQHQMKVLRSMRNYSDQTNWVVTDTPIYAALIRKPVPPKLATFTLKRVATKSLTEDNIIYTVKTYRPEQVLLTRFNLPNLENYLIQNYNLIQKSRGYRLYIRNDLYKP